MPDKPLSRSIEKIVMDKQNKESELKKLVKAIPTTIEECFLDISFVKSLNKEFRKRTTTANSARIISVVALMEIVTLLKSIDSKLSKEEDEVTEEVEDNKSSKKLKSRNK